MTKQQERLWGEQTALALANFRFSGQTWRTPLLRALAQVKVAAARANASLGLLDAAQAAAIEAAGMAIAAGEHAEQFPLDVYQTGSGTSTNMNMNEVIAALAARDGVRLHPNDHVNYGQSSNDVIPSTIQIAVSVATAGLLPAIERLAGVIDDCASRHGHVVKTGRTHLMDAVPLTLAQELGAWSAQLRGNHARLRDCLPRLAELPLGGTAVGTGLNCHPRYAALACEQLSELAGMAFRPAANAFAGIAAKDECVELSGQLKTLAVSLMKIANDLRWMNSGPLAGLGEIELPALQAGSSIMPGKVNPVIPEAVAMICARVYGNDVTLTVAGQSGNFQLNVMLPLIGEALLESIELLQRGLLALADKAIDGLVVRQAHLAELLQHSPLLVTALNARIGYARGAALLKQAREQGRSLREVLREQPDLDAAELEPLLDPALLARGGLPGS